MAWGAAYAPLENAEFVCISRFRRLAFSKGAYATPGQPPFERRTIAAALSHSDRITYGKGGARRGSQKR
ncbi:MAG: hypothetical protein NVSMB59_06680 [Vulcanimicrobiaceae bacterium]